MTSVNACSIPPDRIVAFVDFVTGVYLPWVKETKKPSTHKGCNDVGEHHLKTVSSLERIRLKDMRTFTVQQWLNRIGQKELSRNSLKRIQSMLSGIFKQAKRLGFYDGVNPVQDTALILVQLSQRRLTPIRWRKSKQFSPSSPNRRLLALLWPVSRVCEKANCGA